MKETKSTPAADIRELVTAVKAQMSELGYSQYTIDRMDAVWKNLASYCEEHNDGLLTAESARGFVWDLYGAVLGEKDASQNVNRAVHILLDFQQFGMIFKQSHMTLKSFSDAFSPLFEGFLEKQRKDGFAEGSVRTWRSRLFRFEYFLANSGIDRFSQIELHHLNAYIETLAGFSSGTVGGTIKLLGRLSDYALANGWHSRSFSGSLPDVRRTHSYRLPTVFTPEEVERILASVDRDNAQGKRNYAVFLLVARLGLRISDVRLLRFDSIDWQNRRISITQKKTGVPLELPLPDDAGWAIIDYLKHGRPETDCGYIFVRHTAPFDALKNSFRETVVKAVQKAGVKVPADKPVGMHSFRHSIATAMLSNGVKLTEIAQTLGHTTPESTQTYISTDTELLRQCALEVDL